MRRGRIFFYLAFILILGLVAVVVVWQRFLSAPQTVSSEVAPTPVDIVNVIVVTQKVPRGSALDDKVLGMVPLPRDLFIQGMFTDVNEVKGRLARFDLDAGIPLTSGMLVDSAEQLSATGSTAALSIPRGMVSVSIPISRLSSVSYAPQAGDHVNVIVTMLMIDLDSDFQTALPNNAGMILSPGPIKDDLATALVPYYKDAAAGSAIGKGAPDAVLGQTFYQTPNGEQRPRMVSQTLLQDAIVLRMGDFDLQRSQQTAAASGQSLPPSEAIPTEPVVASEPGGQEAVASEPVEPDVISLIVNPQDAVTLNYLIYSGAQLTLALRSAQDDTRVQTEAVTLQFLLDQYNIPVPVKLPYGMEPGVDQLAAPVLENDIVPTPTP